MLLSVITDDSGVISCCRDYFMTLLEMVCTEPVHPLFPAAGDSISEQFVLSADVALYIDEVLHPR